MRRSSLDGLSISLGVIVIDKGNRTHGDTDFANTVNHEWGHFIHAFRKGILDVFAYCSIASMLHCNFGESKYSTTWDWICI
jgi:hypothetical protein